MKRLLMLLGILVLSTGMVVAQDTAQDQNAQGQDQDQAQQDPNAPDANADVDADVDANADVDAGQDADAGALPQTASPLPLLALLGLGTMAAGIASRRK